MGWEVRTDMAAGGTPTVHSILTADREQGIIAGVSGPSGVLTAIGSPGRVVPAALQLGPL